MSTVAAVLEVPGVSTYLDAVEERLRATVARNGGVVAAAGADTLASGGKRLRPMLVHLCAPPAGRSRPGLVAAGCAVELVHMATLVHDDQIDAAPLRRGRPTVWRSRGPLVSTASGDYLFAQAFSELVTTGDMQAVTVLSDACLALARGEILQREQAGKADTTPEQYLERCRLKTGRLFAAAATLGARLGGLPVDETERMGEFGIALGAGIAAGSIALIGFGADSLIESLAAVVVLWLFTGARIGSRSSSSGVEHRVHFVRLDHPECYLARIEDVATEQSRPWAAALTAARVAEPRITFWDRPAPPMP